MFIDLSKKKHMEKKEGEKKKKEGENKEGEKKEGGKKGGEIKEKVKDIKMNSRTKRVENFQEVS